MIAESKTVKFFVSVPSERSAGIRGFEDEITVTCLSGDFGGDTGEFEKFMVETLKEWYDTNGVGVIP